MDHIFVSAAGKRSNITELGTKHTPEAHYYVGGPKNT
jgi:hypothetical protein